MIRAWLRDFGQKDDDISWNNVWENIFLASKNQNHQLIHFKVCHRLYYTPVTRFRMKLIPSPICTMCQLNAIGCYKHMMWECPFVQAFWGRVSKVLSELLGTVIICNPILLLLNDDSQIHISGKQRKLLLSGLTAAKKLLVQRWLPPHNLSIRKWLIYFHDIVLLELSTARINNAKASTLEMWSGASAQIKDKLLGL